MFIPKKIIFSFNLHFSKERFLLKKHPENSIFLKKDYHLN
ncbi:hypothetical protein C414_000470011 [Campylobacter jejuni subsp. jejuni 414]|nr:hypothetical protein C414_000470011 [Campylobacter jejuni subsp. jejuni 414]